MQVRAFQYDSPEYRQALELRNQLLRIPLGLDVHDEPLELEAQQWHFGLFAGQRLVGCTIVVPLNHSRAKLRQMAIETSGQGQGWGRQLLSAVEKQIRERGMESVELAARTTATGFYEKLGYRCVGEVFEEVGIPHVAMQKRLL